MVVAVEAVCEALKEKRGRATRAIAELCSAFGVGWVEERVQAALARRAAGELRQVKGGKRSRGGAFFAHVREELGRQRFAEVAPSASGRLAEIITARKAARAAKAAARAADVSGAEIENVGASLAPKDEAI